ncbi:MAG: malonyl-CoA decarboxylase [Acidiferrobacterales bacterium]|nr:malonyl-CoA decarboxylase [Acidiferrobacterales bacterium]
MSSISLSQLLNIVADTGADLFRKSSTKKTTPAMLNSWCEELLSAAGEASGITLARQIVNGYATLPDKEKIKFFRFLNKNYEVDADEILKLANDFHATHDARSYTSLVSAVESGRQEIFRRINQAPDGISTLVAMRRDLLHLKLEDPSLALVENDLAHLLSSWFNKGFLTLRRIDWNTPAAILEKVIQYESVHEIKDWRDLRGRLAADRMCFAFFHGNMPDEPIVFVEVALVNGMSESIEALIDRERRETNPAKADTAIFYSINNCHEGLIGIPFGSFLIKQVLLEIRAEFPKIRTFATLSPVPKFRKWLKATLEDPQGCRVSDDERAVLKLLDKPGWNENETTAQQLSPILLRLAARYFLNAKSGKEPYDPVARFHLRNGAKLARINWLADRSSNGLRQSAGILVNYVYDPDEIVRNHEEYSVNQTIAAAPAIRKLARKQAAR